LRKGFSEFVSMKKLIAISIIIGITLSACGLKGPPQPPPERKPSLTDNEHKTDQEQERKIFQWHD